MNEVKPANVAGVGEVHPATVEELAGTGIVPGHASPIGIRGALVVVDDIAARAPNLVAGANREGTICATPTPGATSPDRIADITAAHEGAACPDCGTPLRTVRGVEIGQIFKLGTRYSSVLGATFLDEGGQLREIVMGCYGIGVSRLIRRTPRSTATSAA
ncbi:MAG: aminoacyl--tRNA ligase-related protein [Chloroflexia bacterium]